MTNDSSGILFASTESKRGLMDKSSKNRWILLIHSIPQKPDYFRVKVRRQLQKTGALAIKNSIYILPNEEQYYESFQWVTQEIIQGNGEASVCEANFVEGLNDEQIESLFRSSRDSDYNELIQDVDELLKAMKKQRNPKSQEEEINEKLSDLNRLQKRLAEIKRIDFFHSSRANSAEQSINKIERILRPLSFNEHYLKESTPIDDLKGRIWVTRKGVHIDRIASAWLIKKFIDPDAQFKFVAPKGYKVQSDELRFDMYEAEFTHEGDLCTFEVLLARARLKDRALQSIARIVHEIDLRDEKFESNNTPGIEKIINGLCMSYMDDDDRIKYGSIVWEAIYEYFKRKRK